MLWPRVRQRPKSQPRIAFVLRQYTVLQTYEPSRRLAIALVPKIVLSHDAPRDSSQRIDQDTAGKSWYLSAVPGTKGETETIAWFHRLQAACEA